MSSVERRRRGAGSVTAHGGGWRARLPAAYGRRSLGVYPTEAEAYAILDAALAELAGATLPTELTLDAWGVAWLEERERAGEHKARTLARDRCAWSTRVGGTLLGQLPLVDVEERDVRTWLAGLRRADGERPAPSTLSNALVLVRGALEAAVLAGRVTTNAARGVRLTRPMRSRRKARARGEWTWLTDAEIERVLATDAIPLRARAAYATAIYAGLRAGELWGLRWADVDLGAGVLHVRRSYETTPKSHQARDVAILPPLRDWLEAWRRASALAPVRSLHDLVWPARDGRWHADGYDAGWPTHRVAAGLTRRVRLHDLRHTCASHLLQGTWAPRWIARALRLEEVRDWLGHEDVGVTQRYAHLCADAVRSLVVAPAQGPEEARDLDTNGTRGAATYRIRTGDLRFTKPLAQRANGPQKAEETGSVSHLVSHCELLAVRLARAVAEGDPHRDARALELAEAVLALAEEQSRSARETSAGAGR